MARERAVPGVDCSGSTHKKRQSHHSSRCLCEFVAVVFACLLLLPWPSIAAADPLFQIKRRTTPTTTTAPAPKIVRTNAHVSVDPAAVLVLLILLPRHSPKIANISNNFINLRTVFPQVSSHKCQNHLHRHAMMPNQSTLPTLLLPQ